MSDAAPQVEGDRRSRTSAPRRGKLRLRLLRLTVIFGVAFLSEHLFEMLSAERISEVRRFNEDLKKAIGGFSPSNTSSSFLGRLRDDYGWRPISFAAPFNLTEARRRLLSQYPLVARQLNFPTLVSLRIGEAIDEGELKRQQAAYREGLAQIDRYKFPRWLPGFASKVFGVPDAILCMVRSLSSGSPLSGIIGGLTLIIVLAFLFSPKCRSLPGVVMVLPAFTTLIAWILFLPVLLMAKVLDWTVIHILGTSSTAPETSVVAGFFTLLPLMSVTKRLVEHHTTDALLKKVEEIEQRKAVP